jgi:hypothetical protein
MSTAGDNSTSSSKSPSSKNGYGYISFGFIFGIVSGLFLTWICSLFNSLFWRLVIGAILTDLLWLLSGLFPLAKRYGLRRIKEDPVEILILIYALSGKTIIKIWGYTGFIVGLIVGGFASWPVGFITGLLGGLVAGWLSKIELTFEG